MPYGQMPQNIFPEIGMAMNDYAVFHLPSLIIGLALILATIVLTIATWGISRKYFAAGAKPQALSLWLLNLAFLIVGLWFIAAAFPRINSLIVIGVMLILILAFSGIGAVAKKEGDKTSDSGNDKGGGKK